MHSISSTVLMDGKAGLQQQPCYSSFISLRNVALHKTAGSCAPKSAEDLGCKAVLRQSQLRGFGCKHFPDVEAQAKANWSCEFCAGAKLIEQATRSNEAVSSLDVDKLLCNFNTSFESVGETTCSRNAVESTYNKMGSWILRTRARDTPAN